MINFSGIANKSNLFALTTNSKSKDKNVATAEIKSNVISYNNYELSNNIAAMKSQIEQDNIKFNDNFLNNIQYLNAHAAMGMHKSADKNIFVSADAFKKEPTEFLKSASLSQKLEYIDNMTDDVTKGLVSISAQYNSKLNALYA